METPQPATSPVPEAERYRLLVEAVIDYAIYMLDPAGFVSSWNPGAERFKGYQQAEILGRHFSTFYTEEDKRTGLPQRALAIAQSEGRFENEGWRVRKDGSRFWAHVVIDPIWSPSGELLGFAKVTRDLTERRLAEAAIRKTEQQFRLLVQGVTDYAIFMLDPDGRVNSWNPGAQRIKGYLPEEIIGSHFSRFYTEEDRARGEPDRGLATAAREGRFEKEGWRVRKDGSRFFAHVVIDAIRDEGGELIGFAKITRDITESREAQQALEKARETLFQSQKMEALGQLTGGIAHDFNNLLTVIMGSLSIVSRHVRDDPKLSGLIDNAIKGAQRGASLTQRMLAFARSQTLHLEPLELPDLVHGMTDMLQRTLGPMIRIETRFPLGLPGILADLNQLELAVLNLVTNARDAMPEGGSIVIAARNAHAAEGNPLGAKPGRYVCLSVTDTGIGMDEAVLARATDPFFTTKAMGKGTGLGLAMVRGLIEQLGGAVAIHSTQGQGTSVEIWIPAATQQEQERRTALPAEAEPAPATATPTLRVLLVDDDALVLTSFSAVIEELGHSVLAARSGAQALEMMSREMPVDVVVTDYAMPGMTGLELAEAIHQRWPDLPIILASGYSTQVQFPDYLTRLAKPFGQAQLRQALEGSVRSR
ncbi:hybrid sensor histidine kinase/response regulator [Stutzerimonas nosocomialis]|uniref:histidine kinase n=1 Tax=Stutzerimonas nosocomialis TaxID=1056496 RepID=A0A5R9QF59_9GAMM|nr:PAS domain-containing sensor histidine kinase [Stutzerimonas nosocomialis]TLX63630.1 hybrid sensor histidine kinase/response regulator [Stutzerimonas nosocomialis]